MIPIQEIDKLTKNLKKITSKKVWTGQDTGIVLVSRSIEDYIKKTYEQLKEYNFFNFDMEQYKENYKRIGNQLFKGTSEDSDFLFGYIKMNDFFYANFSYKTASKETVKARYLYFYEKLKLAFGIEQAIGSNILQAENEKNKQYYEQYLKPLSLQGIKEKTKKINEAIEDFENALYWLVGYKTLLDLIKKIYKLDLLFLMYKEIDLFVEDTFKRIDTYNKTIEVFNNYITNNKNTKDEQKADKIKILNETYKKIDCNYEIPNKKIKRAIEVMKTPGEKTAVNFYCFNTEILLDLLCDRSEQR